MYVCMYVCTYAHIYIYVYTYIDIYIHICIFIYCRRIFDWFSIDFYIFLTHVRTTLCVNRMWIAYELHTTVCKSYVNHIRFTYHGEEKRGEGRRGEERRGGNGRGEKRRGGENQLTQRSNVHALNKRSKVGIHAKSNRHANQLTQRSNVHALNKGSKVGIHARSNRHFFLSPEQKMNSVHTQA